MPNFSRNSQQKLDTCHPKLIFLFENFIKTYDCIILCGTRTDKEQDELFKVDKSKKRAGESKHNHFPSLAIDVSPYPIPKNWGENSFKIKAEFYYFAALVMERAKQLGISLRWGGDWDRDRRFSDQSFDDLVHFELV